VTTPIERDEQIFRSIESFIVNAEDIAKMDDTEVNSAIGFCLERLHRLRMGGRSLPLVALSVLLWNVHDRGLKVELDIENCLALSFRIAGDPSFVQPEWGLVLVGVLLSRYQHRLSKRVRDEVIAQSKLLLEHYQKNGISLPVRRSAQALKESWNCGFPNGLNTVFKACLNAWPDTSDVAHIPDNELKQDMDRISGILPVEITLQDRKLYRLNLERRSIWKVLERISLD